MSGEAQHDELDQLLGGHLRRRLDPQVGRAAAAFEAAAAAMKPIPRGGGALRIAIAASGLIAAMIVIAWAIARPADDQPPLPPQLMTNTTPPKDFTPREIERMVMWRTIDDGAAVVGDSLPVRKLRHEAVEQVQYYDPQDRATIRVTVPLMRDVMVEMETY